MPAMVEQPHQPGLHHALLCPKSNRHISHTEVKVDLPVRTEENHDLQSGNSRQITCHKCTVITGETYQS